MKYIYLKKFNKSVNIKKYIYILIKKLNIKYYFIYKKINNNIKLINKYLNKLNFNYYFQIEDKEILKYIFFLNIKYKKKFNIYKNKNIEFLLNLNLKIKKNKKKINLIIKKTIKNWDIKRINIVDLIILQMAICEFFYLKEKNKNINIIINEYINISKIFSTYKSRFFINGILDKIFKTKYK